MIHVTSFNINFCVFSGNSPLLKTIFEVDIPSDGANVENIHEEPSLWRFRSHISLEHLAHALDESMAQKRENENKEQTYPILQLFIKYVIGHFIGLQLFKLYWICKVKCKICKK